MPFYFTIISLVGAIDNKEAYLYYCQLIAWCHTNLSEQEWQLDRRRCILQGQEVASGITIYGVAAAISFVDC